jgi:hypothetical protein
VSALRPIGVVLGVGGLGVGGLGVAGVVAPGAVVLRGVALHLGVVPLGGAGILVGARCRSVGVLLGAGAGTGGRRSILEPETLVVLAERQLLHLVRRVEHAELGRGLRDRGAEVGPLLPRLLLRAFEDCDDLGQRDTVRSGLGLADADVLDQLVEPHRRVAVVAGRARGRHARHRREQHAHGDRGRKCPGPGRAEEVPQAGAGKVRNVLLRRVVHASPPRFGARLPGAQDVPFGSCYRTITFR